MNHKLAVLKLALAALWLVSILSCGSQQETNGNSPNIVVNNGNSNTFVGNGNSNTNVPANKTTVKEVLKDPKEVCGWLPEFTLDREYKFLIDDTHACRNEKTEKVGGGKMLGWKYSVSGTATGARDVELLLASDASAADNQKAEKRFVEIAERLWQKAFAKPLPAEFKDEMLRNKGKPVGTKKEFSEPVKGEIINLKDDGDGTYGMYFRFYFFKL